MGLTPMRTMGLWWTEKWLLKDPCADLPTTGHRAEIVLWKVPRSYVKETHLLILRHWSEVWMPAGTLSRDEDWWTPPSYSSSVKCYWCHQCQFLPSFFLCIFPLPLCLTLASECHLYALTGACLRAPISLGGELLQISGALLFISCDQIFVDATQRTSLDHFVWKPWGLAFLVPMELQQSETAFGRLPLLGHCTNSSMKYISSLFDKEFPMSRGFGLRGKLLVWHT